MTANNEQRSQQLSAAEFRARIVGNSLERDADDIQFWREASEAVRGQTLYRLLRMAQNIVDSKPPRPEEPLTFPGFRRKHRGEPSLDR